MKWILMTKIRQNITKSSFMSIYIYSFCYPKYIHQGYAESVSLD